MNDSHDRSRRRAAILLLGLLCAGLLVPTIPVQAEQVKGTVVNHDGAAQIKCRVNFVGAATYDVWTNAEGAFYLENPARGDYQVTVYLGGSEKGPQKTFDKVTVNEYGLSPSTLVVDW